MYTRRETRKLRNDDARLTMQQASNEMQQASNEMQQEKEKMDKKADKIELRTCQMDMEHKIDIIRNNVEEVTAQNEQQHRAIYHRYSELREDMVNDKKEILGQIKMVHGLTIEVLNNVKK